MATTTYRNSTTYQKSRLYTGIYSPTPSPTTVVTTTLAGGGAIRRHHPRSRKKLVAEPVVQTPVTPEAVSVPEPAAPTALVPLTQAAVENLVAELAIGALAPAADAAQQAQAAAAALAIEADRARVAAVQAAQRAELQAQDDARLAAQQAWMAKLRADDEDLLRLIPLLEMV